MFDKFYEFLGGLTANSSDTNAPDSGLNDVQLAAAALMSHVIQADGVLRPIEKQRFEEVLSETYAISGAELNKLIKAAFVADSEAVDFYQFTSVLMNSLDETQRINFIEMLWEMVYADGVRHEMEDNVVWRVSELLGVSGRDRVLMRQRVQARLGTHGFGDKNE